MQVHIHLLSSDSLLKIYHNVILPRNSPFEVVFFQNILHKIYVQPAITSLALLP